MFEELDKIKTNFLKKIDEIFEEVKKEAEGILSKSETKHIHADLMKLYEEDKKKTSEPWKLWEFKSKDSHNWQNIDTDFYPAWDESTQYRRKPQFININGFEVPEPERNALDHGDTYYLPVTTHKTLVIRYFWQNDDWDYRLLAHGMVHISKKAAEIHARAIISFTKSDE